MNKIVSFSYLLIFVFQATLFSLPITLRTRRLTKKNEWIIATETQNINPQKAAIIICDLWNKHWCKAAAECTYTLAKSTNNILEKIRPFGFKIIHAASDSTNYYRNWPQRKAFLTILKDNKSSKYQLPIMATGTCACGCCVGEAIRSACDCYTTSETASCSCGCCCTEETAWCALHHPACSLLPKDPSCPCAIEKTKHLGENKLVKIKTGDFISENGDEIYNFIKKLEIEYVFILGIHLNLCVWGRSFGIKPMLNRGIKMVLVRDLTAIFPNPDLLDYLTSEQQTEVFVAWLEKYWCPTIESIDLC